MKDNDLVATYLIDRLGQDLRPLHMGVPHNNLLIAGDKKDLVQLDVAAWLNRQTLNLDNLSRGNPVLLSSGLDYCVNRLPPVKDADYMLLFSRSPCQVELC